MSWHPMTTARRHARPFPRVPPTAPQDASAGVRANTAIALGTCTLEHLEPAEGGNAHIAVVARLLAH